MIYWEKKKKAHIPKSLSMNKYPSRVHLPHSHSLWKLSQSREDNFITEYELVLPLKHQFNWMVFFFWQWQVCLWHHSASAYTFCPLLCFWRDTKANKNCFSKQVNPMCSAACQEWHRHNTTLQMKGWKSRETLKWLSEVCLLFGYAKKALLLIRGILVKYLGCKKSDRKEKKTEPGVCVFFGGHFTKPQCSHYWSFLFKLEPAIFPLHFHIFPLQQLAKC